jgi:hypothetical protein
MNEWTAFLIKSMESLISSFLPNLDLGEGRTDFIVPGGTNGRRESLSSYNEGDTRWISEEERCFGSWACRCRSFFSWHCFGTISGNLVIGLLIGESRGGPWTGKASRKQGFSFATLEAIIHAGDLRTEPGTSCQIAVGLFF